MMTSLFNFSESTTAPCAVAQPSKRSALRSWATTAAAATLLTVGVAQAQPAPGGMPPGGRHGGDPAQMAERRLDHMIKAINGTPEQKAKLTQLAQAAMADVKPLRDQLMASRQKSMQLLAAASIDRNALEQTRAEQVKLQDSISRRTLSHLADAAEVLTPAQRSQLAERMKSMQERGRGPGAGRGFFGQGDARHGEDMGLNPFFLG